MNVEQLAMFPEITKAAPAPTNPADDLVAQERAALVTAHLYNHRRANLQKVRKITGLTYCGVWRLMSKLCRVLPLWYDRSEFTWKLNGRGVNDERITEGPERD